jgi:hypothetical protein
MASASLTLCQAAGLPCPHRENNLHALHAPGNCHLSVPTTDRRPWDPPMVRSPVPSCIPNPVPRFRRISVTGLLTMRRAALESSCRIITPSASPQACHGTMMAKLNPISPPGAPQHKRCTAASSCLEHSRTLPHRPASRLQRAASGHKLLWPTTGRLGITFSNHPDLCQTHGVFPPWRSSHRDLHRQSRAGIWLYI